MSFENTRSSGIVIDEVSSYIARGAEVELPREVIQRAKHHILDSLAAIVSGSMLKPGKLVKEYAKIQGGVEEALVIGSKTVTSAINAAFANGVMGHADETDDVHSESRTHPGCVIVPAALSMSQKEEIDGIGFLRGVVVGYDICSRIVLALGVDNICQMSRDNHGIGGSLGAAAAAAAIAHLEPTRVRYVLSYAAQQASGLYYWPRDEEHIEKAFLFGGMPARNGVTAATLVQSGFTGISDPFSGEHNFFQGFPTDPQPELLIEGLGTHYEIMYTSLKKYSVGYPIQAPLDGILLLAKKHSLTPRDIESVVIRLPSTGARIVNNRNMPDINLQHIIAVALFDGKLTFDSVHSYERMDDPPVRKLKECITLVEDAELSFTRGKAAAIVEVTTKDGSQLKEQVMKTRGTVENPMNTEEVENKCGELMTPVLGEEQTKNLINAIWKLEKINNIRDLQPLLSGNG